VLTLYFQRTQSLLSRRLGVFGTLSFISPLLGLLGTVLGVMAAFRDLALTGSGGRAWWPRAFQRRCMPRRRVFLWRSRRP
jgi:hypothetical protein